MKKKPLIGIIDTQTSNIKSVYYALNQYNIDIEYISSKDYKKPMDAMIVPGIGNFSFVMGKLKDNKFDKLIETNISKNIPSLFICVGMQILFTKSYEFGEHNGLNIFSGEIKKIPHENKDKLKIRNIPMIGWNKVKKHNESEIFKNIENNSFFYFTHSFYADPKNKNIISSTSNYLGFEYCSSVSKDKIFATQFHPEKSGETGLKIYNNFINSI